jgi:thiol-disulfide isomerase/thioredoxin
MLAVATLATAVAASRVDLPFKDLGGRRVHLKDLRGKPVVLNFWATWCVPCRAEMPIFVEMKKQYAPRGVAFVAVSLDDRETRPKIPAFIEEFKIDFEVWTGGSTMDLADLKLGQALPATAFLDPEGRIVARVIGQVQRQELQERLEWLAGGMKGDAPNPLLIHVDAN